MDETEFVSIKSALEEPKKYSGWFYLPRTKWTLETKGTFVPFSKDVDITPNAIEKNDLKVTIDSDTLEDIVSNAHAQVQPVSINDLFRAFLHYNENDAFIVFK